MIDMRVIQLRNILAEIAQNNVITNLAQRNLSEDTSYFPIETHLSDNLKLLEYDAQEIISRKEVEMRVSQNLRVILSNQKGHVNVDEIFGRHKDLCYCISEGQCAFFVRLLDDYYGIHFAMETGSPKKITYEIEVDHTKMFPKLLLDGKFDGELTKIISDNPTFDHDTILKKSIIKGIRTHIKEDLIDNSFVHKLFVRKSFGTQDLYWDIKYPSYLDQNPTWEKVVRFEEEAQNYTKNTIALVNMLFADKPNIKSGIDMVELTQEDQNELYERMYDKTYFKKRRRKIKKRKLLGDIILEKMFPENEFTTPL